MAESERVIKQVIVMRTDLGMRKGKMIAQGAHASMKVFFDRSEVLQDSLPDDPANPFYLDIDLTEEMRLWVQGLFTKVCVQAGSEEELRELYAKARGAKLPCALIEDAGKTEFHGVPTPTCIAIGPADASAIDEITGHLKLL